MLKAEQQDTFNEYLRWRGDEGSDAVEIQLEFHVHITSKHPELAAKLGVPHTRIYQELARLVTTWERQRK
jgi:hypothetical protein